MLNLDWHGEAKVVVYYRGLWIRYPETYSFIVNLNIILSHECIVRSVTKSYHYTLGFMNLT